MAMTLVKSTALTKLWDALVLKNHSNHCSSAIHSKDHWVVEVTEPLVPGSEASSSINFGAGTKRMNHMCLRRGSESSNMKFIEHAF